MFCCSDPSRPETTTIIIFHPRTGYNFECPASLQNNIQSNRYFLVLISPFPGLCIIGSTIALVGLCIECSNTVMIVHAQADLLCRLDEQISAKKGGEVSTAPVPTAADGVKKEEDELQGPAVGLASCPPCSLTDGSHQRKLCALQQTWPCFLHINVRGLNVPFMCRQYDYWHRFCACSGSHGPHQCRWPAQDDRCGSPCGTQGCWAKHVGQKGKLTDLKRVTNLQLSVRCSAAAASAAGSAYL